MTAISNNDIARAIYLSTKDKSHSEQPAELKKVVSFLSRRNLLGKSRDILLRLEKIVSVESGTIIAKVISSDKLTDKSKKELEHILKEKYSAKHIILEEAVDQRLLGGYRIEINDEVIDLTVKNKVNKLKAYLTRN